ncbi:alpha/beta hydrolase [Streptococcus phocae]|uniref:Carboxylesterase n=1 Tax=Streptococcus phocae TaxID=119224 RepID=A0A0P6S6Y2_9STRE|nr:alpha/beta hydrolase [Streptococcus phocae]KPJ22973.1 carboxylesterase [Streptococcus phocae]
MEHIFQQGQANGPTLILLHGTGGNEESLLSVAEFLNPTANLLSLRGSVNENGALRFFKRHAEGQFDVADLEKRGQELLAFLKEAAKTYHFDLAEAVLVGFSNGANIAINILLADNSPLKKGILFAPMYPVDTSHLTQEKPDTKVFLSMGTNDPIVPITDCHEVIDLFEQRNANVQQFWVNSHEIRLDNLQAAKHWLDQH